MPRFGGLPERDALDRITQRINMDIYLGHAWEIGTTSVTPTLPHLHGSCMFVRYRALTSESVITLSLHFNEQHCICQCPSDYFQEHRKLKILEEVSSSALVVDVLIDSDIDSPRYQKPIAAGLVGTPVCMTDARIFPTIFGNLCHMMASFSERLTKNQCLGHAWKIDKTPVALILPRFDPLYLTVHYCSLISDPVDMTSLNCSARHCTCLCPLGHTFNCSMCYLLTDGPRPMVASEAMPVLDHWWNQCQEHFLHTLSRPLYDEAGRRPISIGNHMHFCNQRQAPTQVFIT
jgi:hypothetical protein